MSWSKEHSIGLTSEVAWVNSMSKYSSKIKNQNEFLLKNSFSMKCSKVYQKWEQLCSCKKLRKGLECILISGFPYDVTIIPNDFFAETWTRFQLKDLNLQWKTVAWLIFLQSFYFITFSGIHGDRLLLFSVRKQAFWHSYKQRYFLIQIINHRFQNSLRFVLNDFLHFVSSNCKNISNWFV